MDCPKCGSSWSEVLQSRARPIKVTRRSTGQGKTIRLRRRECKRCGTRYTTREETLDGSVQPGDSDSAAA